MGQILSSVCDLDFGRSFLRFSSTRVQHTPRLRVDSLCTLLDAAGQARRFFHSCPCIAESMYVPSGLIQEPVAEFAIVLEPGVQFLAMKRLADGSRDMRTSALLNQTMPTHDGKGTTMIELAATLKHHARVAPVTDYQQFRSALLGDQVMIGRTTYPDPEVAGGTVVLEYPVTTSNVAHDRQAWQVDAGPLVVPAFPAAAGELPISRFSLAYLVFNRWDYAELAIRQPTALVPGSSPSTLHYSLVRQLPCRNELFAVVD